MEYYIYVTNECNLNCSYCSVMFEHEKANIPSQISYTVQELRKFIDNYQNSITNNKQAVIYFFGGEPTLEYEKIKEIINAFDDVTEYKITYILHTNGLLLDEIPYEILNRIDVLFLSLNYEKVYTNGQLSQYFSSIINSIIKIKQKKKVTIIGRFTLSSNTSLFTECSLTILYFDYVYWQLDNQKTIENIDEYKQQYKSDVELLYKNWLSFLKKDVIINYIPFLGIIRHILNNVSRPMHYYCGYGEDIVYIQTDGSCYACCDEVASKAHYVGNIFSSIKFDSMEIKSSRCLNCDYLNICGGRCGRMHKDFSENRIQDFCEMNIFLFNLILDSISEIKAIINKNPKFMKAINDPTLDYTEIIP